MSPRAGCVVQSKNRKSKTNTTVQTRVLDFYLLINPPQWGMVSFSSAKRIVGFSRCLLRNDAELAARIIEKVARKQLALIVGQNVLESRRIR